MNERAIFEAALEIEDPAKRGAFIEKACDNDTDLRRRIYALLKSHKLAASFLEVPAVQPQPQSPKSDTARPVDRTMDFTPKGNSGADDEKEEDREVALSFLQPSSKPDSLGVLGHYEILQILGQGGFGIVFKAFDEKLHRLVAIKVMSPQMAATSPPRKRFLREARAAAAIKHENIVQVYSVEEQPLPYLVMEYVDGQTLAQKLDGNGPLETAEVLHIARQIASGLAAAHEKGLIHRDIKPGNILIEKGADRKIKITDFGLARAVDDASMTRTGTIAGTPMYMAPEQAMGKDLDHRADLFSFGSVMYQTVCGRPPFRASTTIAVLRRVAEDTPRPLREILPEIPTWLATIVNKLLQKNPDDRYQSAKEVADLIARCQLELQQSGKVTCVPKETPSPVTIEVKPKRQVAKANAGTKILFGIWLGAFAICATIVAVVASQFFGGSQSSIQTISSKAPTTETTRGEATPKASWHGWPSDTPPPAIAPFNAAQAKKHQEEWAAYLKVPVEYTNSIGMKFRLIPPGEFMMGSSPEEIAQAIGSAGDDKLWQETINSEGPMHKVVLTKATYMGVHEVTQGQFEQIMGRNPSRFGPKGASKEVIADLDTTSFPVEKVSWDEATRFCMKLGKVQGLSDGKTYRLPTDAEWEFSCRAGTTTEYWTGDNDQERLQAAWLYKNSSDRTHAVGELKGNPFGLYDVHGNVWEWVQDAWDPAFYNQLQGKIAVDPIKPTIAGAPHVTRGGCWNSSITSSRSTSRCPETAAYSGTLIGFRVSLTVEPAAKVPVNESVHTAPDRKAAEWVLSVGGKVGIDEKGKDLPFSRPILAVSDLPPGAFELTAVDLSFNRKVSDAGVANFKDCKNLTWLALTGTQVTDAGLAHFKDCKDLAFLNLPGNQTTDAGLAQFKECKNLRSLGLTNTQVTNAGLIHFNECKSLASLDLEGTQVTDVGLAYFKDCKNLSSLNLRITQTSDVGLAHFKDCKNLVALNIQKTELIAAKFEELKKTFPKCKIESDYGTYDP